MYVAEYELKYLDFYDATLYSLQLGGRTAKACDGHEMYLRCSSGSRIRISSSIIADSSCYRWLGNCCEGYSDCSDPVSSYRMSYLRRRCDGDTSCGVTATKATVRCSYSAPNEYEKITYDCIGKTPSFFVPRVFCN